MRLAIPKSCVFYLNQDIGSEQRISRQPALGAGGMLEAGTGGHTVPPSRKTLLMLEKSDNELCCEPWLTAVFDGFSGNSPFRITPFFPFKAIISVAHTLHTRVISGMAFWDLLQIQMVQESVFDKDQHNATIRQYVLYFPPHNACFGDVVNTVPYSNQHSASLCSSAGSLSSPKCSRWWWQWCWMAAFSPRAVVYYCSPQHTYFSPSSIWLMIL